MIDDRGISYSRFEKLVKFSIEIADTVSDHTLPVVASRYLSCRKLHWPLVIRLNYNEVDVSRP